MQQLDETLLQEKRFPAVQELDSAVPDKPLLLEELMVIPVYSIPLPVNKLRIWIPAGKFCGEQKMTTQSIIFIIS